MKITISSTLVLTTLIILSTAFIQGNDPIDTLIKRTKDPQLKEKMLSSNATVT